MGLADMLKRENPTYPDSDYVGPKINMVDPEKPKPPYAPTERIPHIEIGKAIIDATDAVRQGIKNAATTEDLDKLVDVLAKIDEMHWKNAEKVTIFAR